MENLLKRKAVAVVLSLAMVFQMGIPAFATGETLPIGASSTETVCTHHIHDENCGYSEGTPCNHEHTEECYTEVTSCTHEHTAECYPDGILPATDSEAVEPTSCTHSCGEDTGCITKELNCKHTHDEACGYTEGTPCTFDPATCEICNPKDSGEQGELQEQCSCKVLCTENLINSNCPVCSVESADLTKCIGEEPQQDCTCETLCTDTINAECPVCGVENADLIACKGEAAVSTLTNLASTTYDSWDAAMAAGVTLAEGDTIIIDGTAYTYKGDGGAGIDLANINMSGGGTATPLTGDLVWKADSGYVLYSYYGTQENPGEASVTLYNATIAASDEGGTALNLPYYSTSGATPTITGVSTTVQLEGANKLSGQFGVTHNAGDTIFTSTGTLELSVTFSAISFSDQTTISGGAKVTMRLSKSKNNFSRFGETLCVTGAGSQLTIGEGVTLFADGSELLKTDNGGTLVNNGTLQLHFASALTIEGAIQNNGAIQFPTSTTPAQLAEMNLTGTGTVQVKKENSDEFDTYLKVGDSYYLSGGDVSTGLNLETPPTVTTAYKAGEGKVVFTPAGANTPAKLTLTNATVTSEGGAALKLGSGDYTVILVGENKLQGASREFAIDLTTGNLTIDGDGTLLVPSEADSAIRAGNSDDDGVGNITIGGSAKVEANTDDTAIWARGDITIGGSAKVHANVKSDEAIEASEGSITIKDNASVDATSGDGSNAISSETNLTVSGGSVTAGDIYVGGNLDISGGSVTANRIISFITGTISGSAKVQVDVLTANERADDPTTLTVSGNAQVDVGAFAIANVFEKKDSAVVNGLVFTYKGTESMDCTVYGEVVLTEFTPIPANRFTVSAGASLTVSNGVTLDLTGYTTITNSGTLTVNGTLVLPAGTTTEDIKALKLSGTGWVEVGEELYFTNGSRPHSSTTALDFSKTAAEGGWSESATLDYDGYEWNTATKTLTLKDLNLTVSEAKKSAITLPNADCKLVLVGVSTVIGNNAAGISQPGGSLTVTGTGTLKASGTNSVNGYAILSMGKLTVESGTILDATAGYAAISARDDIEIKNGTIDLGDGSGMSAMGTLTISGGSVTVGSGIQDISSLGAKTITISGGVVKTGKGSVGSILTDGGDITISGGTVIANRKNDPDTWFGICAWGGNVTLTGGSITASGSIAAIEAVGGINCVGEPIETTGGVITDTGMTAVTIPANGTVKGKTVTVTDDESTIDVTVSTYTDDNELILGNEGELFPANACKTVTLTKTPVTPPDNDNNDNSNDDSSSNSGGGSTVVTPPVTPENPNPPTEVTTTVKPTVSGGTATANVSTNTINSAIQKAQDAAKKNGTTANGIVVEIKVDTKNTTASNLTANLPKVSVDALVKANTKEVRVTSGIADIHLNLDTLKEIQKQIGTDVSVTAKKVDNSTLSAEAKKLVGNRPVYDFSITGTNGKAITDFGNGKVSVSIPYTLGKNENPANLVAYYIDKAGKVTEMPNSVYDPIAKTLSFVTDHFSKFAVGYKDVKASFTDTANHWAKDSIAFVAVRGILAGTGNNKFSPNTAMTRGMFVTALGRLAEADVSKYTKSSFTDVKSDAYYMGYVEWASKNGIVKGVGNDKFEPDQSITREQMAVIMQNYAKAIGFELPKVHTENAFADNAKISSYAKNAVKAMQMAGILSGKNSNKFDPQGTATRAEVSAVLKRFVELAISTDSAEGWTVNDSGRWMYYENGKAVTGKKNIDGTTYTFDQYGVTADVPKNRKNTVYVVQPGDSFWRIAYKQGCTIKELELLNNKNRFSIIHPGDELIVPEK